MHGKFAPPRARLDEEEMDVVVDSSAGGPKRLVA